MSLKQKKTKIVATVGPACGSPEVLERLVSAGVNVFRLNFSHGEKKTHRKYVEMIRAVSKKLHAPVGILADLQGPKIRTSHTRDDAPTELKRHAEVVLTSEPGECTDSWISVDYPNLEKEISPGQIVVINDGAIRMKAKQVDKAGRRVVCTVTSGGVYSSRKGVNFPNAKLSIPSLTEKDLDDLDFILSLDVQYIALSFVRKAEDIAALRKLTKNRRPELKLIAKIEKPEAAAAVEKILSEADGIMAARGDLGVEASPHEVPILQKDLIRKAEAAHKPVIVATQMLESMIDRPLPTRAESSDVANAIFDGADAVMLSGETAVGAYPLESVRMMTQIARSAEASDYFQHERARVYGKRISAQAVCEAAAWASAELGDIPICVFTLSGDTVLYLSKIRTPAPVFAFSPDIFVVNMLSVAFNVTAFHIPFRTHMADLVEDAEQLLVDRNNAEKGDRVVFVSGTTPLRGAVNIMQIKQVAAEVDGKGQVG